MQRIQIRERGRASISNDAFNILNKNVGFAQLIDEGIVSLVRTKNSGTAISAGPYVGEALIDGVCRISVEPKVPDALAALLRWSVPSNVRVVAESSLVGSDNPVLEHFMASFLTALSAYLNTGRLRHYSARTRVAAVPRGRIDIRGSIALEARGRVGVVMYTERRLTADNPLNRFLGLALLACEEFCASIGLPVLLARTRSYLTLFEDVRWRSHWAHSLVEAQRLFVDALGECPSKDAEDAVLYGRAILWNLGAWPTNGSSGVVVPHSFFLSLESIFEEAVRNVIAESYPVSKGSALEVPMFPSLPRSYVADPDLVLLAPAAMVIDTKYRDIQAGLPGHGELYQLHSHTRTLDLRAAMLVYPAESVGTADWRCRDLGATADGIRTFVGIVDVAQISESVNGLLAHVIDLLGKPHATSVVC